MTGRSQRKRKQRTVAQKALRQLLLLGLTGAAVFVGVAAWFGIAYFRMPVDTVDTVEFERELEVPPLADSELVDGVRTFDLTMQTGETDLGQDQLTPTWGINGSYLGPTIRANRGEQVQFRIDNELSESTTLHWHGMHLPAEMDGGPHSMIEPGETWTPEWLVDQPAASLWYHPHPHGRTASHVYMGLAGMFIIDGEEEAALHLPRDYGVDDLPLIVQDRKFNNDGTLDMSSSWMQSAGVIGDTTLVNGTPGAYFDVTTETVRLRILNGSNTRPYNFAFEDDRAFHIIGSDGGLLEAPVEQRNVQLSPGERAEIVVTFEPGEEVRLQSGPTDTADQLAGGADHLDIMQLRAGDDLGGVGELPEELVEVDRLEETSAAQERDFALSGTAINGRSMDMNRVDEVITMGDTEIWNVENVDGQTHNFHIHDVQFQILDIDGEEPPPHLRGWKDTIWLPPGQEFRLIMTFTDFASDEWAYMYHCHILRHEGQGMMGQFLVVEPGESTNPDDYELDYPDHEHAGHHH